jgi:hypothetical protein
MALIDGVPGMVMSIHSFGDYPEKFHAHISVGGGMGDSYDGELPSPQVPLFLWY